MSEWLPRWHPATLVAHLWARAAVARVGRDRPVPPLEVGGAGPMTLRLPAVPSPPPLPAAAERGVASALARSGATCLPRSLVRQAWHAARGDDRDLVIGVTAPGAGFRAHAWLAGDPEDHDGEFVPLTRVRART